MELWNFAKKKHALPKWNYCMFSHVYWNRGFFYRYIVIICCFFEVWNVSKLFSVSDQQDFLKTQNFGSYDIIMA